MCSQHITMLTPEASLYHRHQAEISKVLRKVGDYNRLFVGGISGFVLVGVMHLYIHMGSENVHKIVEMAFKSHSFAYSAQID